MGLVSTVGTAASTAAKTVGTAVAAHPVAIPVTAAIIAAAYTADEAITTNKEYGSYQNAINALDKAGWSDVSLTDIVYQLYSRGDLNPDEYKKAINNLESMEKSFSDGYGFNFKDVGYTMLHMPGTHRASKELLDLIASKAPELAFDWKQLSTENGLAGLTSIPSIANAPTPEYLDTDFKGTQLPVEPVHWWTGQELADLHNINYDPNSYYDLIKQGTEADVAYNQYLSDQMNDATMVDDTKNVTSYLDSIRNNKAEAIATGATMGARAANEVLNNVNTFTDYSGKQAESFTNRFNTTNESINANARAMSTAQDYFVNLAKALSDDSMGLYFNDSERYGQELLSNAELYAADQNLRGQRAYANASMYADQVKANAAINQYRQGMQDSVDDYNWVFNNYLNAGYNLGQSKAALDNYIRAKYENNTSFLDFLKNNK